MPRDQYGTPGARPYPRGRGYPDAPLYQDVSMAQANFDTYGAMLKRMQGMRGQEGLGGTLEEMLRNFRGQGSELQDFWDNNKTLLASTIGDTKAFRDVQDYERRANLMPAYGTGAGQIAAAGARGQNQAGNALAGAGLARSGAMASLAQRTAQQTGGAQAGLYSNMYQQQQSMRSQYAQQALDAHRNIATLALGHNPMPRQEVQQGPGWGQIGGTVAGGLIGAYYGGAGGAQAGMGIGGAAGSAADSAL